MVQKPYFGIRVVEEQTGRGVPLVTLTTTNHLSLVTDSNGWAAFYEPGLMDTPVWFSVSTPGYEKEKDGFGYAGARFTTTPGKSGEIKVRRTQIAERLYRITGQGIYRDSVLLGQPTPLAKPETNAGVLGQDSVQVVPYRGRLFWLWGDTTLAPYPLGIFQVTAAWSDLPGKGGLDPAQGVRLEYLTELENPQQARKAAPVADPGVVWLFGLLTVSDETGNTRLIAHYSRRQSLTEELEHGLMQFNDDKGIFERLTVFDLKGTWRFPRGNAVRVQAEGQDWFYFASPFCYTRVRATLRDLKDPARYEALRWDEATGAYRWQSDLPPTEQKDEQALRKAGKIPAEKARYMVRDANGNHENSEVSVHGASVCWNDYRKKWILVGHQAMGKASFLGEVWYAEADAPEGPWQKAVQIATHPNYSFYNVRQHPFFDQQGGKMIYFEGTYTTMFSGNPTPTPRYEYNQLMYRLDLSDPRLKPAFIP
ncbi:MAG: DUF4185 domain-containing protein [Armatimonadaceae bacterium]